MSLSRLPIFALLPLLSVACGKTADTGVETDADTDTDSDTDSDSDADSDTDADTALALFWYEGDATVTPTTWIGSESAVVYDISGTEEYCRVTNPDSGAPSAQVCEECAYAFDVVFDAGTMDGPKCDGTGFTASMYDGAEWTYGYAPEYTYGSYSFTDVLMLYYEGYGFYFWSYATVNEGATEIEYVSNVYYTYYYL